ncbi:MAG: SDR family NAD(P)-dependent oxidoreductase, partial [Flavobacteriaceae bacterium]|nr:SDR family NAD(P)-dependent oxidoreductase [Flavobacteriaceae bacterium]
MSKVFLITGGSSGIGKAVGEYFSEKGHIVYGTSRNPEKYALTSKFPLLRFDAQQPEVICKAVDQIIK